MRLNLNEPNPDLLRAHWLELAWRGSDDCAHVRGSLGAVEPSAWGLIVEGDTITDWTPLSRLKQLDYLYLAGCSSETLAQLPQLPSLKHLIIRGSNFRECVLGDRFPNLEVFSVWDAPKLSAWPRFTDLPKLRFLALNNIPRLPSLCGLVGLNNLQILVIQSPISWDSSGKRLPFESFAPLADLRTLLHLDLAGVAPKDADLSPIGRLPELKSLFLSLDFPVQAFGQLARALPETYGNCLKPYAELGPRSTCPKCKAIKVFLIGQRRPRSRREICPHCNHQALQEHVAAFELGA